MQKKEYVPPKMDVIQAEAPQLLCGSNDNKYWAGCWEESDDGYWSEK